MPKSGAEVLRALNSMKLTPGVLIITEITNPNSAKNITLNDNGKIITEEKEVADTLNSFFRQKHGGTLVCHLLLTVSVRSVVDFSISTTTSID